MAGSCTNPLCLPIFSPSPVSRRSASAMLLTGMSHRSHDNKAGKTLGDQRPVGARLLYSPAALYKFDGAARSCTPWDPLKKQDPELWLSGGGANCFAYFYEKGHSSKGPVIKIPFSSLLSTQCQPLIERFVDRTVSEDEAFQNGRVDLYISAPAGSSRSQAALFHNAIRNLFAWVSRRSVVGEHLGSTLVVLMNAMVEFREPEVDNVADLLDYLDEEGYLDMQNHPDHALGILHLAEVLQMSDLYTDAFAHCVGMSEHLYKYSEYSRISLTSRRLIRKARADMDLRLSRAGAMLGNFLEEELSEAYVGLSTSARAHLDRFRAHVHVFYRAKFGTFPPPAADSRCSAIYRPVVYRTMKADFEALYYYLVDVAFTTADHTPLVAQGGLCAKQSVHEFDLRHNFTPLDHPLPLLPAPLKTHESRRRKSMPWMGTGRSREGKLRPGDRLAAHAALMQATNHTDIDVLDNELVMTYRRFEEASVMKPPQPQHKGSETGMTPGDARKVRWLFIYAMYQTLRSCVDTPHEASYPNNLNADYHIIGVSRIATLPWEVEDRTRSSTASAAQHGTDVLGISIPERGRSIGAVPLLSPFASMLPKEYELKPDIDYFALNHQEVSESPQILASGGLAGRSLVRSHSKTLPRTLSLRRSLSMFRQSVSTPRCNSMGSSSRTRPSLPSPYHEIIVQGYGNGTNNVVNMAEDTRDDHTLPPLAVNTCVTACRSASTSSTFSQSSLSSASPSTAARSSVSTTATTLGDPHSPTSSRQTSESWQSTNTLVPAEALLVHNPDDHHGLGHGLGDMLPTHKVVRSMMYSNDDMLNTISPPPLPRRSSKRVMRGTTLKRGTTTNKRWTVVDVSASLREDDRTSQPEHEPELSPLPMSKGIDASTLCVWEQYADLGGLRTVGQLT